MKKLLFISYWVMGCFISAWSLDIQGIITDSSGLPVPGAEICFASSANACTQSNAKGIFRFNSESITVGVKKLGLPTTKAIDVTVNKNVLSIFTPQAVHCNIEFLTLQGKKVVVSDNLLLAAGINRIQSKFLQSKTLSIGLLRVRTSVAEYVYKCTLSKGSLQLHAMKSASGKSTIKTSAAIADSLIISKVGFETQYYVPAAEVETNVIIKLKSSDWNYLPPKLPTIETDLDKEAARLAKAILYSPSERTAALIAALAHSGIGVKNPETNTLVVQPDTPSQGYAITIWEVQSYSELMTNGMSISLANLDTVLNFPSIFKTRAPLDSLIVNSIKQDATEKSGCIRFWARLITELGKQSKQPYNLLDTVRYEEVFFDPLQTGLISLRFAADLYGIINKPGLQKSRSTFHLAKNLAKPPCSMGDNESFIMDVAALASTYGLGKVLEWLADNGASAAETYGNMAGGISAALGIVKYIASGAAFKATMELEGDGPLLRTMSTSVAGIGENRVLKGKVQMNIGNWQGLNCARMLLNAAGTDFNLPQDGVVADAKVYWTESSENAVLFYLLDGPTAVQTKTNTEGITRAGIQGNRQPKELPAWMGPVYKKATITMKVALNETKLSSDIMSALGVVTSGPFSRSRLQLKYFPVCQHSDVP